jgi:hypothetical protein
MNRRPALGRLSAALVLTCAALFGLAGCGQATEAPEATAADDPTPTSGPDSVSVGGGASASTGSPDGLDPSLAQWPAAGCDSRAVVSVDYGRMPTGFDTPEEAVANGAAANVPDGVLTLAPASATSAKGPAQVWVVDPATNEILAEVSVFRGPDGWFVDGVMTCS